MNAAIYVRVSTKGQEDEGTSLASQEAACRTFAAEQGYAVAEEHVYREVFTGAQLWERPQLTRMREAVRGGEVKAVVAYALDRLSREQGHIYILDDECTRHDVAMLFVTEEFEQTPVGKVIRSVKAFAAELEREKIRERSVRGKRAYAEAGKLQNSSTTLYGYGRDRVLRVRTVDEAEAVIVRRIFRWYGDEGASLNDIVRWLNAEAVPPPSRGKRKGGEDTHWGKSQLRRILTNPAYKGETFSFCFMHGKNGQTKPRPRDQWIRLPDGVTPPLVSAELFDAVQHRLATNAGDATRNKGTFYLLRGLAVCARCGLRLSPEISNGYRYYRCGSRASWRGACGAGMVRAEVVEARVWQKVADILSDPEIITREIARQQEEGHDPILASDREAAQQRLQRLQAGHARLLRQLRNAADDAEAEPIEKEIAAVGRERRETEALLADLDTRLAAEDQYAKNLRTIIDYCHRVKGNLAELTDEQRRLALEYLGIVVTCENNDPQTWQISGSIPLLDSGVLCHSSALSARNTITPAFRFTLAA